MMTLAHGLAMGVFGTLFTVTGMFVALYIGYNSTKPIKKRPPNPLDNLMKADKLPDDVL